MIGLRIPATIIPKDVYPSCRMAMPPPRRADRILLCSRLTIKRVKKSAFNENTREGTNILFETSMELPKVQ